MINKNSTSFSAPSFASYFTQEVKPVTPVQMTIADIAKAIDNFDYYYEASDSDSVWSNGERSKAQIVKELRELTPEQLQEVKALITIDIDAVCRYFAEFFTNLPEVTPEVVAEPSRASKVMTLAWELIRAEIASNLSEGLTLAWKKVKAMEQLRKGIAYITFIKADGTERKAIGTLRQGNYSYESKNSGKKKNPSIIPFWDLEKKAFRACRIERLIEVAA